MKANGNFSKRTNWFKVSMALVTCLLFLAFPSCQKEEFNPDSTLSVDALSSSAASLKKKTTGKIKDVDGNWYNTVKIGDQWWMADNLKTTKYNDRTSIPLVTDNTAWVSLVTPGYCWYNNDPLTYKPMAYGALYNWYVVDAASNGGKNVCPTGWRVPSETDWAELMNYLVTNGYYYGDNIYAIAKSLAANTNSWNSSLNQDAPGYDPSTNNSSGFSAIAGGNRYYDGTFWVKDWFVELWSTSEFGGPLPTPYATFFTISYDYWGAYTTWDIKQLGFGIRCLRNN
jgi:uncharacterized protein (TIGR02145 family)